MLLPLNKKYMEKTKQEIFQLLLSLHKKLLEEQKEEYEKTYGVIENNNQYFQLVVSHEDFEWLRRLSALIASYDEALESSDKNTTAVSENIVALLSGDNDPKFYQRLQSFMKLDRETGRLISIITESLKNLA
jgi:hypothetical protein